MPSDYDWAYEDAVAMVSRTPWITPPKKTPKTWRCNRTESVFSLNPWHSLTSLEQPWIGKKQKWPASSHSKTQILKENVDVENLSMYNTYTCHTSRHILVSKLVNSLYHDYHSHFFPSLIKTRNLLILKLPEKTQSQYHRCPPKRWAPLAVPES